MHFRLFPCAFWYGGYFQLVWNSGGFGGGRVPPPLPRVKLYGYGRVDITCRYGPGEQITCIDIRGQAAATYLPNIRFNLRR